MHYNNKKVIEYFQSLTEAKSTLRQKDDIYYFLRRRFEVMQEYNRCSGTGQENDIVVARQYFITFNLEDYDY